MNISSIVVQCKQENFDAVQAWCKESEICDYHFGDKSKGKIIVTIEGEGVEEEIAKLTEIQKAPGILAADMMMSYQEELDGEIKKLEESGVVPQMLNDDEFDPATFIYNGDLKKRF